MILVVLTRRIAVHRICYDARLENKIEKVPNDNDSAADDTDKDRDQHGFSTFPSIIVSGSEIPITDIMNASLL